MGATGSVSGLLVSRVSRKAGLDTVAERIGYPGKGAYVYLAALFVLDLGVLSMVQYASRGFHPLVDIPLGFVPPGAVVFGVWAERRLARRYDDVTDALLERADDPDPLREPLAPFRLQAVLYLGIAAGGVAWFSQPRVLSRALELEGPIFWLKLPIVLMGLYYLVIADVAAAMAGIHLLLPWRLVRAGIDLDFADPMRLGGLHSVGRLVQRSTQVYFVGLFVYTLVTFAPRIFPSYPTPVPGLFLSSAFVVGWLAGFALFLIPTAWLHREMKRQKEARLESLYGRLAEHGEHPEPLPDAPADEAEVPRYLYLHLALERTERTREYPTDAALLRDLGISSMPAIVTYLVTLVVTLFGT